ncbi:MAG: MoaD/ThiS family protein [Candidatus Hodarchaeales archaeon]|jgi:molybdopterin converting factor small subunit
MTEIKVKLYATLRKKSPTKGLAIGEAFSLAIKDNSTILDVLKELEISEHEVKIIMINSVIIQDFKTILNPDDLLVCFPPVGGG